MYQSVVSNTYVNLVSFTSSSDSMNEIISVCSHFMNSHINSWLFFKGSLIAQSRLLCIDQRAHALPLNISQLTAVLNCGDGWIEM